MKKNRPWVPSRQCRTHRFVLEVGAVYLAKDSSCRVGRESLKSLAEQIAKEIPGQKGFSDKNLWRMKQFYEAYAGDAEKLSHW